MSIQTTTPETHDEPNVYFDHDANAWVYRVSAIGNCSMQLSLFRQGVTGAPPPEDMQRRFDDGHLHEASIIEAIGKQRPGWTIHPRDPDTGRQFVVEKVLLEPTADRAGVIVRGHTDGESRHPAFNPDARVLEAKAFSRDNHATALKALGDDPSTAPPSSRFWEVYPYYARSISVYMDITGLPCDYGIKNKDTGEVTVFHVPEPPVDPQTLYDRVMEIDEKVESGGHYDSCDVKSWPCPMFRFHTDDDAADDPEAIMAAALGTLDAMDPDGQAEMTRLCEEYDVAREAEKAAKETKKELARKIGEALGENERVKLPGFTVFWKDHTHRYLDEDAMVDDGVDVEMYRRERKTSYPMVMKKKGT